MYYTEEGRINLAASNRHEYSLKDHLGNTRVCFTPNPSAPTSTDPKILQQTKIIPMAYQLATYANYTQPLLAALIP